MRYKDKIARAMAINAESIASANTAQLATNTQHMNGIEINVKYPPLPLVGCMVDGVTNDTVALQAIENFVAGQGGGVVFIPTGICIATLQLDSNVKLRGAGWTVTFIRCPNNAGISNNNGVVQSRDFNPSLDLWQYYTPYPDGLCMGIQLEDICIDGNADNNTTGNGLCIYGGKLVFNRIGVINVANTGIWTQTGDNANSMLGTELDHYINMHESKFETVFISNCGNRGWYYNGPNDSYMTDIQIKSTGGTALYVDLNAWNLKIGTIHAYFTNTNLVNTDTCMYQINAANLLIDLLHIDTPTKDGVYLVGNQTVINRINIIKRNSTRLGAYYGVNITSVENIIGMICSTPAIAITGTIDGGDIKISGNYNLISGVMIIGLDSTICSTMGIYISGAHNTITDCVINGYNTNAASQAIHLIGTASNNYIRGRILKCSTGVYFNNSIGYQTGIGNSIDINTDTVTTPLGLAVTGIDSNYYRLYDDVSNRYQILNNTEAKKFLSLVPSSIVNPNATTLVINGSQSNSFTSISLSASFLLNLITNSIMGDVMILVFTNTSASSITLTTNAGYLLTSIVGNTKTMAAGQVFGFKMVCIANSGNWVQI